MLFRILTFRWQGFGPFTRGQAVITVGCALIALLSAVVAVWTRLWPLLAFSAVYVGLALMGARYCSRLSNL